MLYKQNALRNISDFRFKSLPYIKGKAVKLLTEPALDILALLKLLDSHHLHSLW